MGSALKEMFATYETIRSYFEVIYSNHITVRKENHRLQTRNELSNVVKPLSRLRLHLEVDVHVHLDRQYINLNDKRDAFAELPGSSDECYRNQTMIMSILLILSEGQIIT